MNQIVARPYQACFLLKARKIIILCFSLHRFLRTFSSSENTKLLLHYFLHSVISRGTGKGKSGQKGTKDQNQRRILFPISQQEVRPDHFSIYYTFSWTWGIVICWLLIYRRRWGKGEGDSERSIFGWENHYSKGIVQSLLFDVEIVVNVVHTYTSVMCRSISRYVR